MPHYDEDDYIDDEDYDDTLDDDLDSRPLWQTMLPVLAALIIGGIAGLILGAQFFNPIRASGNVNSEACLVLASELYGQGEGIEVVQEHLRALGYENAAPALERLADDYEASGELPKKRLSTELRQLAAALTSSGSEAASPAAIAMASPPSTPLAASPTAAPQPTRSATPTPTEAAQSPTSVAIASPTQPAIATPTQRTEPTVLPTATQWPSEPTQTTRPAHITSSGGQGAIMREQPTTNSDIVDYLSHGDAVEVLDIVDGEAIDETEPRWYHIKSGNLTGYVYFKLIVLGD